MVVKRSFFSVFKLIVSQSCATICHHPPSGYKAACRLLTLGHFDIHNNINPTLLNTHIKNVIAKTDAELFQLGGRTFRVEDAAAGAPPASKEKTQQEFISTR